jgi:hypothetical protein
MAKKSREPRKIPVDTSILSDEDRVAIRKEAISAIDAERSQDARDAYFAEELAKLRRKHIPAEQIVNVRIDIAPYLPHLLIDGDQYFADYTYDVERSRAIGLYEAMQRSWAHQDEIDGRSRFNAYRRPHNSVLGPGHVNQPTRGANGIITLET